MTAVLERLENFGYVHHRFLNNRDWLTALTTHVNAHEGFTDIAEGDLCWLVEGKKVTAYLWHPKLLRSLTAKEVNERAAKGQLLLLEDILSDEFRDIIFIIELKTGVGDTDRALEHILSLLEEKKQGYYWIDTFSPRLLARVKAINPTTVTSLHTKMVIGSRAIKIALEPVPLSFPSLYNLPQVDLITATYKTSLAAYFDRDIDVVHRHVANSGKKLVLGGIQNQQHLDLARQSMAIACYPKYEKEKFSTPS